MEVQRRESDLKKKPKHTETARAGKETERRSGNEFREGNCNWNCEADKMVFSNGNLKEKEERPNV